MLPLNLALAASVTLTLFLVTGLIQAARKKTRVGCWSNFLLFIALVLSLASAILNALRDDPNPLVLQIIIGMAAALVVLGIIIYLLERRSDQFARLYSRGLLGIGTGLAIAVGLGLALLVPSTIFPLPTSTPISAAVQGASDVNVTGNIVPTEQLDTTPTPEATYTPTQTYTPLPQPTSTRTRRAYVPPTITPTPEAETVSDDCDARVTVNLNVRAEPTTEAEIVAIVPEGTYVNILARNDEGTWWQTDYDGESGWVFGEFLELDLICQTALD